MNYKLSLIKSCVFFVIITITFGCATKYGAHFQKTSEHDNRYKRADQANSATKSDLQSVSVTDPVKGEVGNEPGYVNENNDQTGAVASITKDVISKSPITDHVKAYEKKVESIENKNLDTKTFRKEVKIARKELKKEIKSTLKREIKEAKEQGADDDYILMMVLAFLIPPLGIGLTYGITNEFWISLILTLLFWIPGAVYSLIMVNKYYKG